MLAFLASLVTLAIAAGNVRAETHTVQFTNQCGFGTPTLVQAGKVLSAGAFTSNGPFLGAIAFLQTGSCGVNGEGCTIVEASLTNAGVSSADLSVIPPHTFSVATGFAFFNGCDGAGLDCTTANCPTAFQTPEDVSPTVECTSANVNLEVTHSLFASMHRAADHSRFGN
ncbi:glycopeptide [Mycena epipterygia]|nr:glycopeptide [Mycena epipterygia]